MSEFHSDHYLHDHPQVVAAPVGLAGVMGELLLIFLHDLPLIRGEPNTSFVASLGGALLAFVGFAWCVLK